jgi:hypothetical protein
LPFDANQVVAIPKRTSLIACEAVANASLPNGSHSGTMNTTSSHQAEHGRNVARRARYHPDRNNIARTAFVVVGRNRAASLSRRVQANQEAIVSYCYL